MCWTGQGRWGLARPTPGLPAMGTDISGWRCWSFLGSEGELHLSLYFIAFHWGRPSSKTCLNVGTPDGMGTHSQLMPRVSVSLFLVLPATAAPSSH